MMPSMLWLGPCPPKSHCSRLPGPQPSLSIPRPARNGELASLTGLGLRSDNLHMVLSCIAVSALKSRDACKPLQQTQVPARSDGKEHDVISCRKLGRHPCALMATMMQNQPMLMLEPMNPNLSARQCQVHGLFSDQDTLLYRWPGAVAKDRHSILQGMLPCWQTPCNTCNVSRNAARFAIVESCTKANQGTC